MRDIDDDLHQPESALETGCLEDVPTGKALLVYSRWQIGHQAGDRFEPLFTFPV
jgi:hypothetical protein